MGLVVDALADIVIDRPCPDVAAYADDPTNAPRWFGNVESVWCRTDPPAQIGSRMDFVARFLGRRLAYTYKVVEFVPGQRLVMRTAGARSRWRPPTRGGRSTPPRARMSLRNRGVQGLREGRRC
jgi:hypothetical protein